MDLDTPAKRLRWARETKTNHVTGTDAARAFGWTVSTYLGHENGDRRPSVEAAKRYAAAYKVPWPWILDGGPLTARTAAADAFISYSSKPATAGTQTKPAPDIFTSYYSSDELSKALIDLLLKMPEGSAEEKAVIGMIRLVQQKQPLK